MTLPDFKAIAARTQQALGASELAALLERARRWSLGGELARGGSVVFPHAGLAACGHQIAAAACACLDSGASRVLALGVLHGLSEDLASARARIAAGGPLEAEPLRGVQGPHASGPDHWQREFSLDHFRFLLDAEARRRGVEPPELLERYPFLVGDDPASLPGLGELAELVRTGAVVVATADPVHHGRAYGDAAATARAWDDGGAALARTTIEAGFALLRGDDAGAWLRHCLEARSDARDVGPVLRQVLGPLDATILDLNADDMAAAYSAPAPSWVATALIRLAPCDTSTGDP